MIQEGSLRLPTFLCIGLFTCFECKDPAFDSSSLVVVWFQESSPVNGLAPDIEDLDWPAFARDFYY
jgi:hypothetical protein